MMVILEKNSHIFQHKENGLQVLSDSGGGSNGNMQNLGVNGAGQRASDRYRYKGAMHTLHRAVALGRYHDGNLGTGQQDTQRCVRLAHFSPSKP